MNLKETLLFLLSLDSRFLQVLQQKHISAPLSSLITALLRSPSTSDTVLLESGRGCQSLIVAGATKEPHLALFGGPGCP